MPGGIDSRLKREAAKGARLDNAQRAMNLLSPTSALNDAQMLENIFTSQQARGESQARLPAELEARVLQNLGLDLNNQTQSQNLTSFEGREQREVEAQELQRRAIEAEIKQRMQGFELDERALDLQEERMGQQQEQSQQELLVRALGLAGYKSDNREALQEYLNRLGITSELGHIPTMAEQLQALTQPQLNEEELMAREALMQMIAEQQQQN